jgi:hypothetical protein
MSGTSLVILALYTTLNITGPGGLAQEAPDMAPMILMLLAIAGLLTVTAIYVEGSMLPRRRRVPARHIPLRRAHPGPKPRRA